MNEHLTPRDALNYANNMNDDEEQRSGAPEQNTFLNIPEEVRKNPEMLKQYNEAQGRRPISSRQVVGDIFRILNEQTSDAEFNRQFNEEARDGLRRYARALARHNPEEARVINEDIDRFEGELDQLPLGEKKNRAGQIAFRLQEALKPYEGKDPKTYVQSLEELAELIMDQSEDKWKTGGELELVDEQGKFHQEHFLAWIRDRALYWDDFNPDSEINLFADIKIPTVYRDITFQEMLATDRYFQERKTLETGETIYVTNPEYTKLRDSIALYDVWVSIMSNHNFDVKYRANAGNTEALAKAMSEIHYNNVFTKNKDRLQHTLMAVGIKQLEDDPMGAIRQDFQGSVGKIKQRALLAYMYLHDRDMFRHVFTTTDGNTEALDTFFESIVGQAFEEKVRVVKQIKFNSDAYRVTREEFMRKFRQNYGRDPRPSEIDDEIDKVQVDIFGSDKDSFFEALTQDQRRREGNVIEFNYYKRALIGENGQPITRAEFDRLLSDKETFARKAVIYRYGNTDETGFVDWKDIDKKLPSEDSIQGVYSMFNIYSDVNFELKRKEAIREAIRKGIQKMINIKRSPEERETLRNPDSKEARRIRAREDIDLRMGETGAFRMVYWTGIAAYNDTNAIAFDKWGHGLNTANYRKRQAAARSTSGIEETIWGLERIGLNFWQGLKVREEGRRDFDKILLEVIQGGEGDTIDLDRDISKFDFQDVAQRQWFVDHVQEGFILASYLIDQHGMDFSKFVKIDARGQLVVDQEQFDKVIKKGIWHNLRYCFDLREFLWKNKIRSWYVEDYEDPVTHEKKQRLAFKSKNLREHMFDEELIEMRDGVYERGKLDPSDKDFAQVVKDGYDRDQMARGVMAYLVAKELKWHLKDQPGVARWGINEVSLVEELFKNWALGYEKNPDTGEIKSLGPFYTDKEWEEVIGEHGDATEKKLRMKLILYFFALVVGATVLGWGKKSREIVTGAYKQAA